MFSGGMPSIDATGCMNSCLISEKRDKQKRRRCPKLGPFEFLLIKTIFTEFHL
uniref:Uncharacterized protein n=1 Tax=Rhizophora mucronata TaxID=61149 RepID=A0A2P2K383_RHIMU